MQTAPSSSSPPMPGKLSVGARAAAERLLRQIWPRIRRSARRYLHRWPNAPIGVSTLTQETALRLSRQITRLPTATPAIQSLINRIVQNTGTSAYRSTVTEKRTSVDLPYPALPQTPEQAVAAAEQAVQVEQAIAGLPPGQVRMVELLREGRTYPEIAEELDRPLSAVYNLGHRIKGGFEPPR